MNLKSLALALVAGIAVFLVVGIAVTALLEPTIEFSVFLGIPVGLVAGAIAAGGVYLGLGDDIPAERRRVALAFGFFGVGLLVTLVVLAAFDQGVTLSIVAGIVFGFVAAVVGYLRGPKVPPVATLAPLLTALKR